LFAVGGSEQAEEQSEDRLRGSGERRVCALGWSEPGVDRAVARFDHDRLIAGSKLDGHRGRVRLAVDEHQLERRREPVAADRVFGLLLGHQREPPLGQGLEHGLELAAARGQAKEGGGDRRRRVLAHDHAGVLELAQPLGEQVAGDPGQPVAQVGVPARPAQRELADDQQRPAVADHVERFRDRAVLVVGPHCRTYSNRRWRIST